MTSPLLATFSPTAARTRRITKANPKPYPQIACATSAMAKPARPNFNPAFPAAYFLKITIIRSATS